MPVREHPVSHRNGSQVMVRGLKLQQDMGYTRGSTVRITDPGGDPDRVPWHFVVTNDEHATLTSKNPPPPEWIQAGVVIRIEVDGPTASAIGARPPEAQRPAATVRPSAPAADPIVTASELADWRRAVVRILDRLDGGPMQVGKRGQAARIDSLRRSKVIPPFIAAMMLTVTEMRNRTEYEDVSIPVDQSAAVRAAWKAVRSWADAAPRRA